MISILSNICASCCLSGLFFPDSLQIRLASKRMRGVIIKSRNTNATKLHNFYATDCKLFELSKTVLKNSRFFCQLSFPCTRWFLLAGKLVSQLFNLSDISLTGSLVWFQQFRFMDRLDLLELGLVLGNQSLDLRLKALHCHLLHTTKDIERVQKRCLKLLHPSISYSEALIKSGIDRLDYRRDMITQKVFMQIKDPKRPLHGLIPPIKVSHSQMVLRPTYPYQLPLSKTAIYKRDFVPFCISKKF